MASKKKCLSTYIGPVGKDVQVDFVAHALGRRIERPDSLPPVPH